MEFTVTTQGTRIIREARRKFIHYTVEDDSVLYHRIFFSPSRLLLTLLFKPSDSLIYKINIIFI